MHFWILEGSVRSLRIPSEVVCGFIRRISAYDRSSPLPHQFLIYHTGQQYSSGVFRSA